MLELGLAYLAGLLTLINPCVLPLLPLIAAGAVARHRLAPLAMALGLVGGFVAAGLAIYAVTRSTGLRQDDITLGAGWLMIGFGVIMVLPVAQRRFATVTSGLAARGVSWSGGMEQRGLYGEAAAGALLGLAWSPCIGPTLGAAISLASTGEDLLRAGLIMVVFGLGTATVLLALSYGARTAIGARRLALGRLAPLARWGLPIAMIVIGLMLVLRVDRLVEGWALSALPPWLVDLSVSV